MPHIYGEHVKGERNEHKFECSFSCTNDGYIFYCIYHNNVSHQRISWLNHCFRCAMLFFIPLRLCRSSGIECVWKFENIVITVSISNKNCFHSLPSNGCDRRSWTIQNVCVFEERERRATRLFTLCENRLEYNNEQKADILCYIFSFSLHLVSSIWRVIQCHLTQ